MTPEVTRAIAHHLRLARLGQALLEALPGAALRIGRSDGPAVAVAAADDPRGDVLPCQHRAALTRALASGLPRTYATALGLTEGGPITVELLPPPGSDLGGGVYGRDTGPDRTLCTVTTLCPAHASTTVRAARTVPLPAHEALTREPDLADLRLHLTRDERLGVTLLSWVHRPHPAVIGPLEDVARAAAAACAVEELLLSL